MWIKIEKQNQLSTQGSVVKIIRCLLLIDFSKLLDKLAKRSYLEFYI